MKMMRKIRNAMNNILKTTTRAKPMQRSEDRQRDVNNRAKKLSLYQFDRCPYCSKVRRALHGLNVQVELKDAKTDAIGEELVKEGGKLQVPCLRITEDDGVRWMYESADIITYLQKYFE